jgi:hypothetical protein
MINAGRALCVFADTSAMSSCSTVLIVNLIQPYTLQHVENRTFMEYLFSKSLDIYTLVSLLTQSRSAEVALAAIMGQKAG